MQQRNYQCEYCGKGFVHEDRFLNHKCKQLKRYEQFETPVGQAAWFYYQQWMKEQRKNVPKSKSFIQSKFFNSFIRFAEFVKKVSLPKPNLFIWLMCQKDISPTIWTNHQVYSIYLEFLDRKAEPYQMVQMTIDTLFKLAEAADCDVEQIFDVLTPSEIITLLQRRSLSPWLLLLSKKFTNFYINCVNSEQRKIIESIIKPDFWAQKFSENPNVVNDIKRYIAELNL